jgi:hypothetical protein
MNSILPTSLLSKAHEAVAKAEAYIASRRSSDGGYCFYKSEFVDEPNLCDTYHAVATLRVIGTEVPRVTEVARFVKQSRLYGIKYLYWYAFTLDCLGRASLIEPDRLSLIHNLAIAPPPKQNFSVREWLEDTCKTVLLMRRFAEISDNRPVTDFINGLKSEGGYGHPPNMIDTYESLTILSEFRESAANNDTRSFLDQRQVPSFGFTFASNSSMTNLDVIYSGVKCCKLVDRV